MASGLTDPRNELLKGGGNFLAVNPAEASEILRACCKVDN
ncbi:hypothetical protein ACPOL_5494 [Acidisarcina polymorpha]|uniref:Uncharacterized protein n=1 Tax=Acidisarcina polymorpha TaxID=2211140 RepID=A0A2Z5G685_9BACT|nr:hypothetical protein ACPOL_5494 [Acidisarcina polymorpha]